MSSVLKRNAINKDFSRNPQMRHSRSVFKMDSTRKMTMNGSYLVPIYLKETIPGDTWEIDLDTFARIMPQVAPVMDRLVIKTYFFWERCNNLWEHFDNMMGAKRNPNDTIDYTVPAITIPAGGFTVGSIFDYMGIPIGTGAGRKINAMPFRMYNRVYNKYFRSEQLQNEVTEKYEDSDDAYTLYTLLKKNKTPDYFTRNLTDTQMGDGVNIPLGTEAPVVGTGEPLGLQTKMTPQGKFQKLAFGTLANVNGTLEHGLSLSSNSYTVNDTTDWGSTDIAVYSPSNGPSLNNAWRVRVSQLAEQSGLVAKLNESAQASIMAFRNALAIQRLLERDNRNGTRYTEILQGRYGVTVPDAFLNRPIYLGGTAQEMNTLPIAQTSSTDSTTPQGNLTGNTIGADHGNVSFSVPDFGYIMGLACISVQPEYQQGLDKLFDRKSRYDFYHPEFNGVGDQTTYNSEIYLQDESVVDSEGTIINDLPFGYNERCAEYKTSKNEICGYMRSTAPLTLDVWHYGEKFNNLPTLNSTFIQDKAEDCIKRSLAVQTLTNDGVTVNAPQCMLDINYTAKVYRGIPVYNIPTIEGF